MRNFVAFGRKSLFQGPGDAWKLSTEQSGDKVQIFAQGSDGSEEKTGEPGVETTAKPKCPQVLTHPLSSSTTPPGDSIQTMGFQNLQT